MAPWSSLCDVLDTRNNETTIILGDLTNNRNATLLSLLSRVKQSQRNKFSVAQDKDENQEQDLRERRVDINVKDMTVNQR